MELSEQFIKERQYLTGVTPKTLIWYKSSFRAFQGALASKAEVLERMAEMNKKGVSNISINSYLRCINAYLRWLHQEHGQPLLRIPRLKEEQKVLATLSPEQIRRVVDWKPVKGAEKRIHTLTLLALDTGLRAEEALSLTREQVDLDNLFLRVKGKGNKERLVPISIELRKALFRYLSHHPHRLVFCCRDGSKLGQRNVHRDLKIVGRKLAITGVRFSMHTFRHTFAVSYLKRGGNLEFLRRILGHTNLLTTQRYLRSLGVEDLVQQHSRLSVLSR